MRKMLFLVFALLIGDGLAFQLNPTPSSLGLSFRTVASNNIFCLASSKKGAQPRKRAEIVPPLRVFFKNKWDNPNYDPTKQEIDTTVPLQIAAFKGDVEEVKRLLAAGADVNEVNDSGWTALQFAARGAGKGQNSFRAVEVCQVSSDCAFPFAFRLGGLRTAELIQLALATCILTPLSLPIANYISSLICHPIFQPVTCLIESCRS